MFSNLTPAQAETGYTSHRCIYVKNEHTVRSFVNIVINTHRDTDTGSIITVAADTAGAGDGLTSGIATTPTSETADPALNFANSATLPNLAPGECAALWFRREIYSGWFKEVNPDVHLFLFEGAF